tara:strand:- start:769 stop:1062 length:294 start_codon:yes stop_codon:yes gene_type:complete
MRFLKNIKEKKFILICTFLFLYVGLNLFDGQRGLISYFEKQNVKKQLVTEKEFLLGSLNLVEKKNDLLLNVIDLDYLEILYREKFMLGKSKEIIYKN